MAHFICEQCSIGFKRERSGPRPIRFCCQNCYHKWSSQNKSYKGCFASGSIPWNKDTKGVMKPNATSFKKGRDSDVKAPIGTVRIRQRKNRIEGPRAWIKVAEPSVWRLRAVVVWEQAHGEIPNGCVVHHEDRNTLNDSINNLSLLSRAAHLAEHHSEHIEAKNRKKKLTDNRSMLQDVSLPPDEPEEPKFIQSHLFSDPE